MSHVDMNRKMHHAWFEMFAQNIFQKKYSSEIIIGKNGFPLYRRKNNGKTVRRSIVELDNQYMLFLIIDTF